MKDERAEPAAQNRLAFLGELAGGLAHEIKNPLSTMRVNLQLLKEDWKTAGAPREVRALRKVEVLEREVKRLEEIVESFLRYARGFDLKRRPLCLNDVVDEVLEFVEPGLEAKGIRLRKWLDPSLPKGEFDPNLVKQALVNLIV